MILGVAACTQNAATGDRQFTGLLPAAKEAEIGAQEHSKIEAQFGKFMTGSVANYVSEVGKKVAANTERADVTYRFYTIDSPQVNAFALPGGYVYVTRGLLTLANSEAELAAVIGHEIGHVTARHAAERMSQGTLIGLGAAVVGIATGSSAAAQAANVGSNLYLSSYSRGQEHESDELGVRYLSRAGYDPMAMSDFLKSLDAQSKLEGGKGGFNYFSTHPITGERVTRARSEAQKFPPNNTAYRERYLHPEMGFAFTVPDGSKINNGTSEVAVTNPNGTVILFDAVKDSSNPSPENMLGQKILKGKNTQNLERIRVNGMDAATASFNGKVQGKNATIRVTVVEWAPGDFFRFQMAIPQGVSNAYMNELKKTTYSLRRLSTSEKSSIRPKTLRVISAPSGFTIDSMAAKMNVEGDKRAHFLVLNALSPNAPIRAGKPYKIVQ